MFYIAPEIDTKGKKMTRATALGIAKRLTDQYLEYVTEYDVFNFGCLSYDDYFDYNWYHAQIDKDSILNSYSALYGDNRYNNIPTEYKKAHPDQDVDIDDPDMGADTIFGDYRAEAEELSKHIITKRLHAMLCGVVQNEKRRHRIDKANIKFLKNLTKSIYRMLPKTATTKDKIFIILNLDSFELRLHYEENATIQVSDNKVILTEFSGWANVQRDCRLKLRQEQEALITAYHQTITDVDPELKRIWIDNSQGNYLKQFQQDYFPA